MRIDENGKLEERIPYAEMVPTLVLGCIRAANEYNERRIQDLVKALTMIAILADLTQQIIDADTDQEITQIVNKIKHK